MTIVYQLGSKLYLNITNACPCACVFCIREQTDGVGDATSLWLEREPSLEEIKAALDARLPFDGINEIVFCGYGEPMERADDVIAISRYIKGYSSLYVKPALRVNTNGLAFLICPAFDISQLATVDTVSISLNADDPAEYQRVTRPKFGEASFDSMLDFARQAKEYTNVIFSVVDGTLCDKRMENCRRIADEIGVELRVRALE